MPGAVRRSQDSAGASLAAGSPDVITNGTGQVRKGDAVTGHGDPPHAAPVMIEGSNNVIVNGSPACHAGHKATCGHPASGSGDVIIN